MKLLPDHSTWVVIKTLELTGLAHITHVLVLTANTPPLGTSGVRVVVMVEMYSSKSECTSSFLISHFVCLGPREPAKGLM